MPLKKLAIHETAAWAALKEHAASLQGAHLRDMMRDPDRCSALTAERDGILLDYSRQRVTNETMVTLSFVFFSSCKACIVGIHIWGVDFVS